MRGLYHQLRCAAVTLLGCGVVAGCGDSPTAGSDLDDQVRVGLNAAHVLPLSPLPSVNPALARLGQALMFDKVLSGNRDISCATCHNPATSTADGLSLSIGTGGMGAGSARVLANAPQFTPRNSQELFNRGYPEFNNMFWDGRVSRSATGEFQTPAADRLPAGLASALAAQAMFPVTTRLEMRGQLGDVDRFGAPNELAQFGDSEQPAIWAAIMQRVLAIPEYVTMFQTAYPGVATSELGFHHAANAIAAFETDAFTFDNSPFDRYLRGDNSALSQEEKQGALLFFGKANCGACHVGAHLTDQQFHSLGVPQLGPGFSPESPEDHGRERVTGEPDNRYQFRTPPLRNVELTAPYMHDGAYTTLEAAVRHYLDTFTALRSYDVNQLRQDLRSSYVSNSTTLDAMAGSIDNRVAVPLELNDTEIGSIVAFLKSLTDPAARNLTGTIPASVPSGLPVGD
jgi:cytochrome c peroxidase